MTPETALVERERALRMSGFFSQTLNERGFRCKYVDLREVLPQFEESQFDQLELAVNSLATGHDEQIYMDLAATLSRLCDPTLRVAMRNAGISMRLDALFSIAAQTENRTLFPKTLAGLRSTDDAVRHACEDRLRTWCGSVQATALPSTPVPVAQSAPAPAKANHAPPAAPARGRAADTGAAAAPASPGDPAVVRRKAKVFGQTAALTVEIAPVRAQDHHASTTRCTVMIEGAEATGDGHFDWSDGSKLVFMSTQRELPQLLAILMGWIPELEFKFHGTTRKKSLHIVHQDHGLLVHLRDTARNVRVPVADPDRYALAMLVLAAMAHNEPHLDSTSILAVARATSVEPAWRAGR